METPLLALLPPVPFPVRLSPPVTSASFCITYCCHPAKSTPERTVVILLSPVVSWAKHSRALAGWFWLGGSCCCSHTAKAGIAGAWSTRRLAGYLTPESLRVASCGFSGWAGLDFLQRGGLRAVELRTLQPGAPSLSGEQARQEVSYLWRLGLGVEHQFFSSLLVSTVTKKTLPMQGAGT